MSEIPKERNRDNDESLMREALTLAQHIETLTAEVRDLYQEWIRADWNRMKAIEGAAHPVRMTWLTEKADQAKAKYEARFTYREERLASNADYIREKVRDER